MGAVAERFVAGVLAAAQGQRRLGGDGEFHGRELAALVGAVAEGLVGGSAAGAPPIVAGLELHDVRGSFCDVGLGQIGLLCCWREGRVAVRLHLRPASPPVSRHAAPRVRILKRRAPPGGSGPTFSLGSVRLVRRRFLPVALAGSIAELSVSGLG